jgi:hypothetical protein
MIKKICLFAIFILSILEVNAQITAFDFNTLSATTGSGSVIATTTANNTAIASISRGAGLVVPTGTGFLSNAYPASAWDQPTLAAATTGNDYFEFTIAANSTYKVSLSAMEANFRRSNSGPSNFQWRYSINGGTSFVDIGTPITYALNNTNGDAQTSINLSTINDLQDVANPTTIIFRLYGWGGSIGGTFALGRLTGNDLAVGGTVSTTLPLITLGTQSQIVSCLGVPTNKTVSVSGTYLNGSAIVFGPFANYTFSKFPGGPFYATDSISYTGATLATTNMYMQYTSTTTGLDTVNIPVGGGGDTALLSSPRLTNTLPNVIISSNPVSAAVCPGQNITLAGTGANTYTWSGGITNNVAFIPSANQTYTITGSDGTCSNTASIQVVVNTLPTITATATPTVVCNGSNALLNGGGAMSYTWDNGVTDNVAFYPTAAQTYVVTGTDGNNCTNTTSIQIPVNNLPAITANATLTAICDGKPTILTGGNGISYLWSGGAVDNTPFYPSTNQTYTVTGTDGNSCTNTATIYITVNPLPSVTANATSVFICEGVPATLSGGGTATSFIWDNGATNNVATYPLTTTTYMVTGSDANSCSNTATIEVIVNKNPTVVASSNANTISPKCQGSPFNLTGSFTANTLGNTATSIDFSDGTPITTGGFDSDADGVFDSFSTLLNASLNTYTVTATDIAGCTATATISITGIIAPNVTAMVMPSSICANQFATVMGSGAVSYVWDNGVADNIPFVGNATTTYQVIGTDAVGCTAASSVQLMVNNIATNLVTATSSTTINQIDGTTVNYTNNSCELISTINDGANGNILGSVTSNVNITPSVGVYISQPYVRRWYEITPSNNGPATITLYLTQADLDDYNANNGAFSNLPTSGNNADPNIANIRITKVDGALGTGTPSVITPTMNWNGNYWEATFNVTSFSQFYFHSVNPLNTALPTTITNFKAVKNNDKDIISWNTLNELNNNYFTVLYSTNSINFKAIAQLASKGINGNSQLKLAYSIENSSIQLGHNYYKLQQTDLDGKVNTYNQILDIMHNYNGSIVTIYPNPMKDELWIEMYNSAALKLEIRIVDMSGRILKHINTDQAKGNHKISIPVNDLNAGIYAVQIIENGKLTSTSKINK